MTYMVNFMEPFSTCLTLYHCFLGASGYTRLFYFYKTWRINQAAVYTVCVTQNFMRGYAFCDFEAGDRA